MGTAIFDLSADQLEQLTTLDRIQARGTLRIALKVVGLDAATLTLEQLKVVAGQVLPGELEARAVDGAAQICSALVEIVAAAPEATAAETHVDAEDIFARIVDR